MQSVTSWCHLVKVKGTKIFLEFVELQMTCRVLERIGLDLECSCVFLSENVKNLIPEFKPTK